MKQETYILRIALDGKETETVRTSSMDAIENLKKNTDIEMQRQGYIRVSYHKVRIDKRKITTITIGYSRR